MNLKLHLQTNLGEGSNDSRRLNLGAKRIGNPAQNPTPVKVRE